MKKVLLLSLLFAAVSLNANPVRWSFSVNQLQGNRAELVFSASIEPNHNMYAVVVPPNGPLPTEFFFNESGAFRKIGNIREVPAPTIKFDETFEMNIGVHTGNVRFIQTIEVLSERDFTIAGTIDYMVCDAVMCLPYSDIEFRFSVRGVPQTPAQAPAAATQQTATKETEENVVQDVVSEEVEANETSETEANIPVSADHTDSSEKSSESFWWFIILAMGAGLAAVLTPCVFPMIPMTVSFFMSGSTKRSEAVLKALIFGFSVAFIYSILGIIVAVTKNPAIANILSTHWIANITFFVLFVAFACSFFGLFEITLPAGLTNKMDAKADKGGLIASFFMAVVLALVSFSCTGPFVAVLLVKAATGTSVLMPILGMFAFGFALGLPFMVLAMSPALLKTMPKSGGWLNSVKVVFAFILLAFSMTFLLTIDTFHNLQLFTREVYIGIWIVIFALMGFYLLGKIKFAHDSDVQHVGVFRLFLVVLTFSFVVYLVPGLFGAPLKALAWATPPMTAQQFNLQRTAGFAAPVATDAQFPAQVRHGDRFTLPHGLQGFFDYEEGLAFAKKTGRPIFLDFTGHGCKNCKEMEARVWSDPEVLAMLRQFVIIALYTNDRTPLPESDWRVSNLDGRVKNTIGRINADMQLERFGTNMLPYYMVLDSEGNSLVDRGVGFVGKEEFMELLRVGLGR